MERLPNEIQGIIRGFLMPSVEQVRVIRDDLMISIDIIGHIKINEQAESVRELVDFIEILRTPIPLTRC